MHHFVLGIFIVIAPSVLGTAWMLWRVSGVTKTPYNNKSPIGEGWAAHTRSSKRSGSQTSRHIQTSVSRTPIKRNASRHRADIFSDS